MRLVSGDNHLISARDGLIFCQVWSRPDLSAEDGARNARDMVTYLREHALRADPPYRGIVFDVRRGPPAFGPKTRTTLQGLFGNAAKAGLRIAILAGPAATQLTQFRALCREIAGLAEVFEHEADAVRWFVTLRK